MTETLTRSAPDKEDRDNKSPEELYGDKKVAGVPTPSIDTLNSMLEAQTPEMQPETPEQLALFDVPTPETPEARPALSPAAELVRSGAERVATFLERRAIDSAHGEALKDYRQGLTGNEAHDNDPEQRQRTAADYTDHVAALAEATDENGNPLEGQAVGQRLLNRENRRETLAKGRDRLRSFGRAACRLGIEAGFVAVGTGVMAGHVAAEGTRRATDATKRYAQGLQLKAEASWDARQTERQNARELKAFDEQAERERQERANEDALEMKNARQEDQAFEKDMREKAKAEARREKRERFQEKVLARAAAAEARRIERREKWAARRERVGRFTTAQRRRLGRFATRARAAGAGAVEGWREAGNK